MRNEINNLVFPMEEGGEREELNPTNSAEELIATLNYNFTSAPPHHSTANTPENLTRKKWSNRSSFLLILIGYTIGLGNVWKFPYLCHKNGGASFLIPYLFFLFVEGLPLYYMELCIGQRLQSGSVNAWGNISPYLSGLGIASTIVCVMVSLYYNVILSWCMFYFVSSFKNPLPWSHCPIDIYGNISSVECIKAGPSYYFWYRTTLNISSSIESSVEINWTIALCMLVAWLLCWISMIKGIRSEEKIVYVTATLPILVLAALFFRGVNLEGFQDGLALLFVPNVSRLKDPLVWLDAASHIFYSLGIAYGSLIAFASHNPLKNDTNRDAIFMCIVDAGVSVYASIVVFCFTGYRANNRFHKCLDRNIELGYHNKTCNKNQFLHEMSQSTSLAFITVTEALDSLPHSTTWSVLFFLMFIILGVDTQFGMLEGLVTPLLDSNFCSKMWRRTEILTGLICLTLYSLSFTMMQTSGNYWLQVFETYCSSVPLLMIALVECITISYGYGMENFSKDIEYMTNQPPNMLWIICWKVLSPFVIVIVLGFSIYNFTKLQTYSTWDRHEGRVVEVPLPGWAVFVGFMLMFSSIIFIPLGVFRRWFNEKRSKKYSVYETSERFGEETVTETNYEDYVRVTVL